MLHILMYKYQSKIYSKYKVKISITIIKYKNIIRAYMQIQIGMSSIVLSHYTWHILPCVAGASTFRFLESCSMSLIGLIMLYAACWFFVHVIYLILFSWKEIDLFWLVFRYSLIITFIVSRHVVISFFQFCFCLLRYRHDWTTPDKIFFRVSSLINSVSLVRLRTGRTP